MDSTDVNDFLYYFQRLKFKETQDNPFLTASIKRKSITQEYFASLNLESSNETTCTLLEDRLREYSGLVDKSGVKEIDNYICQTASLTSADVCSDRNEWKSRLKDPKGRIAKLLSSQKCEVSEDGTVAGCRSSEVTEQDLHLLLTSRATPNAQPSTALTSAMKKSDAFETEVTASNPSTGLQRHGSTTDPGPGYNLVPSACRDKPAGLDEARMGARYSNNGRGFFSSKPVYGMEREGGSHGTPQQAPDSVFCGRLPQQKRPGSGDPFGSYGGSPQWIEAKEPSLVGYGRLPQHKSLKNYRSPPQLPEAKRPPPFRTALMEHRQNQMKCGLPAQGRHRQRGARSDAKGRFVPPGRPNPEDVVSEGEETDERLKNIDPKMVELICNEIMDNKSSVEWDDIAGLEFAKTTIQEIVVWPLLRPDIFTGLRRPPKGILLFGPPGTGKTLIGKCIASQSRSTFFSISASSLTSKWIGEGEKMVRALFAVARCHQPAVVFIDEIDSLLTQRSDSEHESSRRMKTEFLVQLDGAATGEEDRILIIGATNRPQELDEAARRRLIKKLYIPLPEVSARQQLVKRVMAPECHSLTDQDVCEVAELTEGYSGADMKSLCQEASLGPIRSLGLGRIEHISADQVRPVSFEDFKSALTRVRATVAQEDLNSYVAWDRQYGSGATAVSRGTMQ